MAHGHGGSRKNAGRPRNQEKYAEQIASFHDLAAADLDTRFTALQQLADGGFEEIEEEWIPAGLIQINKMVETKEAGAIRVTELAFPELPPEQLVCVKRRRSVAAPDFRANAYLVDRVAGKPVATVEGEMTVDAGDALLAKFEGAVAKIYGTVEGDGRESH